MGQETIQQNEDAELFDKYKHRILIKNHDGYIYASKLWSFRFFNHKVSTSTLQRFKECLKKGDLEIKNKDIKKAISDKNILSKLKKCYIEISRELNNDFNNTSLVLYHSPLVHKSEGVELLRFQSYCFYSPCTWPITIFLETTKVLGQLLTGDANLNLRYKDLTNHFSHHLKNVKITQVPHHGSRKNWNERVINDLPNSDFWIISSGLKNKYGHPSYKVIKDICLNRKSCFWVNEIGGLTVRMKIV